MNNTEYYQKLYSIYMSHPKGYHMLIKAKKNKDLLDWINNQTPLLQDTHYTIATKCYWIINRLTDFPICHECHKHFGQNITVDRRGYQKFCSRQCANKNEETKQHLVETCLKKYGVTNQAKALCVKQKYQQHMEEKYGKGITNAWQAKEVQEKAKQTLLKKFGVDNIGKSQYSKDRHKLCIKETVAKRNATKKKNHTFNTSKPEEECYKLLVEKFGENDIRRQYSSEKYPFACDFYICSKDLYIEYNGSWTHGPHAFDSTSSDDAELLQKWKNKKKKYYYIAANTWSIRDVKKRTMAKQNMLQYKECWTIEEFKQYLKEI